MRFPHLGEQIFTKLRKSGNLDYQDAKHGKLDPQDIKSGLIECREVSRLWKNFIGLFRLLVVHFSIFIRGVVTMGQLMQLNPSILRKV